MTATTREQDVEAAIIARLRALPPERRPEVLAFVEALAQRDGATGGEGERDGDDALIERYIDTVNVDDDHPAYARLANFATPVWAVIGTWKATGDVAQTAQEWDMPVEYVRAALAYYRRFGRYVDALLLLNQEPPYEPSSSRA